jgi:hypothetical protein
MLGEAFEFAPKPIHVHPSVGVGLFASQSSAFLLSSFVIYLRPTRFASIVNNLFGTLINHVDVWFARVGLKQTSNQTLKPIFFRLTKRPTPTLINVQCSFEVGL